MTTAPTQAEEVASHADQPTSAFAEKSATLVLTVIKRLHGFAAAKQPIDGN
ncbi:MAG: hypothetical protein QOF67_3764 [Mycobacterium sp.]|jgi:hypothetical protein|nr:hypothetical protein [Mycobacterium sp.]